MILVVLAVVVPGIVSLWWQDVPGDLSTAPAKSAADPNDIATQYRQFEKTLRGLDETVWSKELLAQDCTRTFDTLWDAVNASSNRWALLRNQSVGSVEFGRWLTPIVHPHGIRISTATPGGPVLGQEAWRSQLKTWESDGWHLDEVEFRHRTFDVTPSGNPDHSTVGFRADLSRSLGPERITMAGDLNIDWGRLSGMEKSEKYSWLTITALPPTTQTSS